jgi:hypothetical protein
MNEERKKIWIDAFQTNITVRLSSYLVACFIVACNALVVWKFMVEGLNNPAQQFLMTWWTHMPIFVCLLALVPLMAWDMIKYTHRVIGPLVRFRQTMQAITRGEAVRPIKLREGDYLTELRDDFNRMLEELQKKGVPVLKPADPAAEEKQRTA